MPSNFGFLKKNYHDNIKHTRIILNKFNLRLPEEWPYELEEIDYSFIQNAE